MRGTVPPAKLHPMYGPPAMATLLLEISLDTEPATGVVCAEGRQPRSFVGWTDLFGQLETELDELRARASGSIMDNNFRVRED